MEPPVRLCCGQRHFGAVCPDGRVMCCICFETVRQDKLSKLPDGQLTDVCQSCFEQEKDLQAYHDAITENRRLNPTNFVTCPTCGTTVDAKKLIKAEGESHP